ncbi:MAG TPA: ankyrin repeat domain-containing protein [Thermoanaerobaculia bacterium]|nr:ankyrin repeat domain-containing protein [Thermoanaerobaculia bacterium]
MSELTDAIQQGDVSRVQALLDSDPALLQSQEGPVTPLLLAIYYGKSDVARLLVDRGAPVSFPEACALGDLVLVQRMLEADPDVLHVRTTDGHVPLGLAIFFRHPDVARLLIERGADVNAPAENAQRVAPVHAAAAACDHATMRLLLERGADPNAHQQMDFTPMHGAASRGDVEMAKLLLEFGAERNPKGTDGQTAADAARGHGQEEFAVWIEAL